MSNKVNQVGLWMDYHHAAIIEKANDGDFDVIKSIKRGEHDDDNFKNERVELSKDSQEIKKYFKSLAEEVDHADQLFIFGPGKSQEEFKNFLKDSHKFQSIDIVLGTSDKISNNQMVAKVKDHFDK